MYRRRKKIQVGVLGATGSVGQRFVQFLHDHPWFDLVALAASDRSAEKRYGEVVRWRLDEPLPEEMANLTVSPCVPDLPCTLVFSALDSRIAGEIERDFAEAGYLVITNSCNHRMLQHVPLVVPEVNPDHLQLMQYQEFGLGGIVANPNCSSAGLVLALKPLVEFFGLSQVQVTMLQALSGAGYDGVASLEIMDNVVPFIGAEEGKVETEPRKVLGQLRGDRVELNPLTLSAQCNRVPVVDGHLACVSVKLEKEAEAEELIRAWEFFRGFPQFKELPSAPARPIHYFSEEDCPQPRLHRNLEGGMAVSVGRLRRCSVLDYKFVVLSHNTVRGAAGGAVLLAETMVGLGLHKQKARSYSKVSELAASYSVEPSFSQ